MESELLGNLYSETSSDDDDLTNSSLDEDSDEASVGSDYDFIRSKRKRNAVDAASASSAETREEQVNLINKLWNRERTGNFLGNPRCHQAPRAFSKVPNRLGFCLKDIIPYCYLQGHMFMGLSACGQFMLSYKVCSNENVSYHYSFNIGYKYTLYFWVYQPHKPFRRYFKSCLFDDHGVDNLKEVTMTQWKTTQRQVLIVHGAAENENEDSYITYVKVPKLGCLECKKLHDYEDDGFFRCDALCLKCNLTVHTKYSTTESDPKFKPYINLLCPERILIIANGFVHMLHIELESHSNGSLTVASIQQQPSLASPQLAIKATPPHESILERRIFVADESNGCDNQNNIVARIIADFSDVETDSTHSAHSSHNFHNETQRSASISEVGSSSLFSHNCATRKNYDEIIFTCNGNSSTVNATSSLATVDACSTATAGGASSKVNLLNHRGGKRNHRIVTKSYRNGVTTVDLQSTVVASTSSASVDKSNAYEFSEDNEKCEKIATFRKRRLADKKYEFSEDNLENIIPFTKIRSAAKKTLTSTLFGSSSSSPGNCGLSTARGLHRAAASSQYSFFSSPCASPSSSPRPSHSGLGGGDAHYLSHTPPSLHRASPIGLGFLSPPTCGSPVGASINRSPGKHMGAASAPFHAQKSCHTPPPLSQATQHMLSFKPLTTLSPLQLSMAKRSHFELGGHMSPNANVPFLSPRREEFKVVEVPLLGGMALEKPMCTKKFKRRYVEEDEAASVITSEEDDCISPGYHTSLPMEVHGSCYSEMQMISQASYQQLRHCTSVVITQHSFDLETFSYYVTSKLCQKNNKIYDVFYDWAYELISICPHSNNIICMLMVQFVAREPLPCTQTNCQICSTKLNAGCKQHRKPCECRILFTWNMETGVWEVLDYGELIETRSFDVISPTKQSARAGLNLATTAKKLARELKSSLSKMQDYSQNLRVLDSNVSKSKISLTDLDNTFEFYLKRPRYSN